MQCSALSFSAPRIDPKRKWIAGGGGASHLQNKSSMERSVPEHLEPRAGPSTGAASGLPDTEALRGGPGKVRKSNGRQTA